MKTKKWLVDVDVAAIANEISEDINVNNGLTRVEQDVVARHPHRPEESTETLNEIMHRRLMASSESDFNSQRFGTFDPPLRGEVTLPRAAGKTTIMEQYQKMITKGMKPQTSQATMVVENRESMPIGNLGSRKLSLG